MTIRLVLATLVGACGLYLLIVPARSDAIIAAGVGLLLTGIALVVDHRY